MKRIALTQNKFALVDDEDYNELIKHRWYANNNGGHSYAVKSSSGGIQMHRVIMGAPPNKVVDHINGNGLDNRRKNLRICTNAENRRNQKLSKTNKSGFKGIYWHKRVNKWVVQISFNNKNIWGGCYSDKNEAVGARNELVVKYHGSFARL